MLLLLHNQFFLTKTFTSGILFLTVVTLDFVAKLVISGFDSSDLILFSNSLTLELKSEVFNLQLTSGIFNSKLPTLV